MSRPASAHAGLTALAGAPAPGGGGPYWQQYRRRSLERLVRAGLPTIRDDGFKYASLRALERRDLRPAGAASAAAIVSDGGCTLQLVDGRLAGALPLLPAGLSLAPLAGTLASSGPAGVPWLAEPGDGADDRLRLWAAACLDDGLVVRVAPGAAIETPLRLVHRARSGGSYPRLRLELGAGSALTLIEERLSEGAAESVTLAVADIGLAPGARLAHVRVQDADARAIVLDDVRVEVGQDASYAHHAHAFGGQLDRLDLSVTLAGRGAQATLAGLFLAEAGRGLHVRTRVTHAAPDTRSTQTYRGIAGSRGRGSYDGKVVVAHGASRANSRQSSRNLLLSADAEIDTRPQLEIYTDDVQCSHGATTGALDEQMLFYLLSRGLDRGEARGLLTYAFAADVLTGLPVAALREALGERLRRLLPGAAPAPGVA